MVSEIVTAEITQVGDLFVFGLVNAAEGIVNVHGCGHPWNASSLVWVTLSLRCRFSFGRIEVGWQWSLGRENRSLEFSRCLVIFSISCSVKFRVVVSKC